LCSVLVSYANDLLAHGGHRCSLAERTQMTLRRFFPHGRPQLTRVANSMGLSPRTLQRRLRVLGSSFRRLLDQSRRELAERYLHDPEFRISEVASQLGYAETSEFHRAFRAWTGTTPKRYRRLGAK